MYEFKGNTVLCQAIAKILSMRNSSKLSELPPCSLEINYRGIRMVDHAQENEVCLNDDQTWGHIYWWMIPVFHLHIQTGLTKEIYKLMHSKTKDLSLPETIQEFLLLLLPFPTTNFPTKRVYFSKFQILLVLFQAKSYRCFCVHKLHWQCQLQKYN